MPANIPVIDLAGADGPGREKVARELVDAAVEHGFLYLRNTGSQIPVPAVEGAFSISRKLFALSTAEKQPSAISTNNKGWLGMHVETLDPKNQKVGDTKEAFNFAEFIDGKPQQVVPTAIEPDVPALDAFFTYCYQLCLTINDLLGIGLEVDPADFFTAAHRKSAGPASNTLRLLYYPPRTSPENDTPTEDVRAGAHSDYGSMTLLFRLAGQAGLEIFTEAGVWQPVPVLPPGTESDPAPPILVNIGDLLAYWTGGLLRSTVHRVVFPSGTVSGVETTTDPRYSIAFFCHPAGASPLTPVPSERVAKAVAKAVAKEKAKMAQENGNGKAAAEEETLNEKGPSVLTADEHLQMRLRATYLDLYKA